MKYEESQKITALGVVIFSFISVVIALLIQLVFDVFTALLVLKTSVPESMINLGSVIGTGVGLIVSTAFLTAYGRIKGIFAAIILSVVTIFIKILGNVMMGYGGYFNLKGLIGIVFVLAFSLIGAAAGAKLK